jgi:putative heme-binding domain-containing protein
LTIPPAIGELPAQLPLQYEATNAVFEVQYADAVVDLRKLARVGSFTIAERLKALGLSNDERQLIERLAARLADPDDRVHHQAAYFLWLLDDGPLNARVAEARRERLLKRLSAAPPIVVSEAWVIGPFDDGAGGLQTVHPPQQGPVDLEARVEHGMESLVWQTVSLVSGWKPPKVAAQHASSYLLFRLQSLVDQSIMLPLPDAGRVKLWHNGAEVPADPLGLVELRAGSNDILLRVAHAAEPRAVTLMVRSSERLDVNLPEKLGVTGLAQRLREASQSDGVGVPSEFLDIDWTTAAKQGDVESGRKLFGADGLGCVKCHAIAPNQKGGGGPSLADAAKRFTAAHVVESVLAPSKQVAEVFGTTSIVTSDGLTLAGLVVEESDERLVLLLPTAVRQEVAKRDIEVRKQQSTSPMPTGLVKTPAELRDLLAYVLSENPRP